MGPLSQNRPNKGQKVPKWPPQELKYAIFQNLSPEYDYSDFLVRKIPFVVDFDPNLPKWDFFRKWPKIGQKMRKIKTCPWPPILVAHMKFSKKSYFEWAPFYQNWPNNGQKVPK